MSSPIIRVKNLRRRFGKVDAVRGVSFEVEPGSVVGFIGANGAGKTTTMRIMATLDLPTSGSVEIDGHDVVNYPNQVRRVIGWMPDHYGTYDNMTIYEYLDFFARAYGYRGKERDQRVQEVMAFTDLHSIRERMMNKLSKGMGQRLCLGRTLLHDPKVLILDEPAAGLDPKARIDVKHLIRILAEEKKTIFISSHILSELGEMCDSLLFIDSGKIVHHGSAESLRRHESEDTRVAVELAGGGSSKLAEWAALNPGVEYAEDRLNGGVLIFESDDPGVLAERLGRMIADGLPVSGYQRIERRLEDAFCDIVGQQQDGQEP